MTRTILAIDPGPETCGVVRFAPATRRVLWAAKAEPVEDLLNRITTTQTVSAVVIERVSAQGVAANDLLRLAEVVGRLWQAADTRGLPVVLMRRYEVCSALGVSGRGKDAVVRQRCIEIIADGDAKAGRGSKRAPGPLYGVSSHAWQALGLLLAAEAMGLL